MPASHIDFTVSMDISELLQANAAQTTLSPAPLPSSPSSTPTTSRRAAHNLPLAGLLTKTVIPSTVARRILPAQIRSPRHNDIVFVGDYFIQLYEIVGHHSSLLPIVRKDDFHARIRAAHVLAEPESRHAFENGFAQEEPIKNEDDPEHMPAVYPPQTLVLTLESHEILFVTATSGARHASDFIVRSYPLPAQSSPLEDPGQYIALDVNSRGMAVAAWQGTIILYNTHYRSRQSTASPIVSSVAIPCNITILQMDFLAPIGPLDDTVYLVVLGAHAGKQRMMVYSWNSGKSLDLSEVHSFSQTLGGGMSLLPIIVLVCCIMHAPVEINSTSTWFCAWLINACRT